MTFCHFYKEKQFYQYPFASLGDETLPKGSALQGKNLLLDKEQIHSFKSRPPLKRVTNRKW